MAALVEEPSDQDQESPSRYIFDKPVLLFIDEIFFLSVTAVFLMSLHCCSWDPFFALLFF